VRRKLSALLIQNLDVKFGLPLEGKTVTVLEEKSAGICRIVSMGSFTVCAFHLLLLRCQNIGLSTLYSVSILHLLVHDLFHIEINVHFLIDKFPKPDILCSSALG
jgi:hypothetical protein